MDYFDAVRGATAARERLRGNPTRFLVDLVRHRLALPERALRADRRASCGRPGCAAEHVDVASPWGHDSFLLDVPEYHAALGDFLRGGAAAPGGRLKRRPPGPACGRR